MFIVVFEVHPAPYKKDEYLDHAKELSPIIESIDGFIDNERFESKRHDGWILSLSTWRDEKAVVRWRTQSKHHGIQELGRSGVFSDYHLRVCEVTADSHPPEGLQIVEQRLDPTEIGEAKALAITEVSPASEATAAQPDSLPSHLGLAAGADGLTDYNTFESIYNPGKTLLLTAWKIAGNAARWTPKSFAGVADLRHRRARNVRDYGMLERREAAQYYPDVDASVRR